MASFSRFTPYVNDTITESRSVLQERRVKAVLRYTDERGSPESKNIYEREKVTNYPESGQVNDIY
jgi:hypothetical protein